MRSVRAGDWYGTGLLIEYEMMVSVVLYFVPVCFVLGMLGAKQEWPFLSIYIMWCTI